MPIPIKIILNDFIGVFFDNTYLWLPVISILTFWKVWIFYIQSEAIYKLNWALLEIKIPKEIHKSPKAMEVFLSSLQVTSDGNAYKKYWLGAQRIWFSLEIVGINGQVRFFIYTLRPFKNMVESQLYAQYPDVEIVEVEDYAKLASEGNFFNDWSMMGAEFVLTKEDALPIRTYVDYDLEQSSVKEEQKTDPITSTLELLGSLKQGEQIWIQILIRATKQKWGDMGKALIDKITERDKKREPGESPKKLTPGEQDIVKAIERDVSKPGFDTGIRAIYVASKNAFDGTRIPILFNALTKPYSTLNLNGLKPNNVTDRDYPPFKDYRIMKLKKVMADAYKRRSYFYTPHERKSFVLNIEELATIYHLPGRVAETPTFGRIEAKKSEPPANLPI